MYTYIIGLIPPDSARNLDKICKKYGCELGYAGSDDGMNDVYIEADTQDKIRRICAESWVRFCPTSVEYHKPCPECGTGMTKCTASADKRKLWWCYKCNHKEEREE